MAGARCRPAPVASAGRDETLGHQTYCMCVRVRVCACTCAVRLLPCSRYVHNSLMSLIPLRHIHSVLCTIINAVESTLVLQSCCEYTREGTLLIDCHDSCSPNAKVLLQSHTCTLHLPLSSQAPQLYVKGREESSPSNVCVCVTTRCCGRPLDASISGMDVELLEGRPILPLQSAQ